MPCMGAAKSLAPNKPVGADSRVPDSLAGRLPIWQERTGGTTKPGGLDEAPRLCGPRVGQKVTTPSTMNPSNLPPLRMSLVGKSL